MGITPLDLTIEEEEKAIVQLIGQAAHPLGGTMFVTGARHHELALHLDSEQTPGCLRLIGDMDAHEVDLHQPTDAAREHLWGGDLAQMATKEDDHRQEDSHPGEKKGSGHRRRFGVQNRLSMTEDRAIHPVAAIAPDGRATQHQAPRDSDPPGEMAHQPLASTNPPELLHQERHQEFCRRQVHNLLPAETTRSMERAKTGPYHQDMLRLHKSSLQNPRGSRSRSPVSLGPQDSSKPPGRSSLQDQIPDTGSSNTPKRSENGERLPEITAQAHTISHHQGNITDRGRHPTHVGYYWRQLALAVDQARANLG
ncbi:hypothetical protein PENANT_c045G05012 [Penicillium antarcticum]|uniref:Uncharacterized protein n=1 Tax=Penicillium antarcticum TaxID=416450 RepID=A0A1V6PSJ6_9EURO|nr:hypothetical protein PENANT_c045G05012 [Penicillium antarcticum]